MSIKKKFLIIVLAGVLLPLGITGTSVYLYTKNHIQNILQDSLTTTGEAAVASIESYILERSKEVNVLSNSRVFQGGDGQAQSERMEVYAQNFSDFSYFAFVSNDGKKLSSYGTPMLQPGQSTADLHTSWQKKAEEGDRIIGVNPAQGANFKRYIVYLRTIKDVNSGQVLGYLGAQLPMEKVVSLFESITFGKTGRVTLFDKDGVLIGHHDRSRIGYDMAHYSIVRDPVEFNKNNPGDYFLSGDGSEKWGLTMLMPNLMREEGLKWGIVLDQTTDELYQPITRIRNMTVSIGALSALVLAVLAILFVRRIIISLNQAIALAGRMSKGDFSQKIKSSRKDEVGALADALNKMVQSLG
ncbi:MAG: cache domain-containing protein, partial [Desulfonatronovibrio sp.]|nr:HAMP domain-containing protein [Desulfovibrionales bacterium]